MSVNYEYPGRRKYMLRRRLGLLLRKLKLRPPENIDGERIRERIAELDAAIENDLTERPTGFDDAHLAELSMLDYAVGRIEDCDGPDHGFYPKLFFSTLRRHLKEHQDIRVVINFGAFFANVDATLALLFPSTQFIAVDRGPQFKRVNETIFRNRNLTFVDSDIEPVVAGNDLPPSMLCHCKTATYLYPRKLQSLYDTAFKSGVQSIVGVENTGFCLGLMNFYDFSDDHKPSAFYKSMMYVHNYPAMLKQAGYTMASSRIAFNGHNHAIVFTASRS